MNPESGKKKKITSYEEFYDILRKYSYDTEIIFTKAKGDAEKIIQSLDKDIDLVIINGGGSHNDYILDTIRDLTNLKIITGEDFGINSDSKEALAFVVMGHQTLLGKPSNVKSVTGAKDYVVLGNITLNPLGYKNEQ